MNKEFADNLRRNGTVITGRTTIRTLGPKIPMTDAQDPTGCRYIIGDTKEKDWRYCQQDQREESSYCDEHHKHCHLPPKEKEV